MTWTSKATPLVNSTLIFSNNNHGIKTYAQGTDENGDDDDELLLPDVKKKKRYVILFDAFYFFALFL